MPRKRKRVTKKDREKVYLKFDGRCAYCGNPMEFKEMNVDHHFPHRSPWLAKTYGCEDVDDISNLMPACRLCNHYKRALMPHTWKERVASLHKRIENIFIVKIAIRYGIVKIAPFKGLFYYEKDI